MPVKVLTVTAPDGSPVAAPCAIDGCQYGALRARIAELEAAVVHVLSCEAALGDCCIEATLAVTTPEMHERIETVRAGGIWQSCGDCDPCLGGRPDQCVGRARLAGKEPPETALPDDRDECGRCGHMALHHANFGRGPCMVPDCCVCHEFTGRVKPLAGKEP